MRKLLVVVVIALAAATGFAVSTLKAQAARNVEALMEYVRVHGRRLAEHGDISIKLFPPSVEIADITIPDDEQFANDKIFSADRVRVYPKLLPMLFGRASAAAVSVYGAELRIVRTPEREVNVGTWILGSAAERDARLGVPLRFSGMTLVVDDRSSYGGDHTEFNDIELELEPVGEDGTNSFELSAGAGDNADALFARGTLRRLPEATDGTRIDATFRIDSLAAVDIQGLLLDHPDLALSGSLDLEGEAHGHVGSYDGEEKPAEPLDITIKGRGGFTALGLEAPLDVDAELAIKKGQVRINRADFAWKNINARATGWTHTSADEEVSVKIVFEDVDTDPLLAEYSVSEQWRPRMTVSGEVKIVGPAEKPRFHYEASATDFSMDFFEGLEIEMDSLEALGVVLAINAEIAYTSDAEGLRVGHMVVGPAHLAGRYWKNKLTVGMHESDLWGGIATIQAAYRPGEEKGADGSIRFDDLDAAQVLDQVFPSLADRLRGRVDAIMRFGKEGDGEWGRGRLGVHRGSWSGLDLAGALMRELVSIDGLEGLAGARISPGGEPGRTDFSATKLDFESGDEGYKVGGIRIDMGDITLMGSADVDDEGVVDAGVAFAFDADASGRAVAAAPVLSGLRAGDGLVYVPARLSGKLAELSVAIEESFKTAISRARAGQAVEPFVPSPDDHDLGLDLATLEEVYGR